MKKVVANNWTAGGEYTCRCQACRDTGYVRCFSPKAMRDAVEHVRGNRRAEDVRISYCDIPCSCDAGDERAVETLALLKRHYRRNDVAMPIRVDDERAIRADPLTPFVMLRDIVIEWARTYQSKLDEKMAERDAPYKVFEDFNNGIDF